MMEVLASNSDDTSLSPQKAKVLQGDQSVPCHCFGQECEGLSGRIRLHSIGRLEHLTLPKGVD
jgi:hypothetical protein